MPVPALAGVTAVRLQKCDHCEREVGKYALVSPSSTSHARVRKLVKSAWMRRNPDTSRHVTVAENISLLPAIPTQALKSVRPLGQVRAGNSHGTHSGAHRVKRTQRSVTQAPTRNSYGEMPVSRLRSPTRVRKRLRNRVRGRTQSGQVN